MIEQGDGSLQRLKDRGLCMFCHCEWNPIEENKCRYCGKTIMDAEQQQIEDQINKAGALE
ncbi:MAG: hypothetical protein ACPG4A_06670 [Pseudomonadales bacterium]